MWRTVVACCFAAILNAETPSELAEQIRKLRLDPEACYLVRDAHFAREDLRFYLTEGVLIFAKPVGGKRLAAIFSADVDGGDAEILLMPPTKGERLSLSAFTSTPNLDEHFKGALFLFTDESGAELMKALEERGEPRKSMERGLLMASKWDDAIANVASSFGVRLVHHLLGGAQGFFYAGIQSSRLGNFDAYFDANSLEQIFLGQIKTRETTAFYDIWTSFPARSYRTGQKQAPGPEFKMDNFRIEASLDDKLAMTAVARSTVTATRDGLRVLGLDLSSRMKVLSAKVDGADAEVYTSESMRANLARRNDGTFFLVIPPKPLSAGTPHEVEIRYEGSVVHPAGRNVYFVGARANWYPRPGLDWARFDIAFRYPEKLDLVFPGDLKEDRTEGGRKFTRRVTPAPIRMAGFNLGEYEWVKQTRGRLTVEVYANKTVELGLRPSSPVLLAPIPSAFPPRRSTPNQGAAIPLPAPALPDPTRRLEPLATEIADAFQFFAERFGPPALDTLRVAPIPGKFGQGFPGLVYLSTSSYLSPGERPAARSPASERFFMETLHAHEAAHQWWGNVVTSATAQDDWLMESLANYSALLVLERKKGAKAMLEALGEYRARLLHKDDSGKTLESAGPIRLGGRLINSQAPESWHSIVYGKGTWIVHMLRRQLGDETFFRMLGGLARQYRHRTLSAKQFQDFAAGYLPKGSPDPKLDAFFDRWVENTGIPAISMSTRTLGRAPSLRLEVTVRQESVEDDFSVRVPVEIQIPRAKPRIVWVTTGPDPAVTTVPRPAAPSKVLLDPEWSVLMDRK